MDLSIIIVSWNVQKHLERCLASIAAGARGLSFEVFVVDNASTDGTVEMLRNLQLTTYNLQLIYNKENRGFAAANNQAIQRAKGEYILLLNPDTEFFTARVDMASRPHPLSAGRQPSRRPGCFPPELPQASLPAGVPDAPSSGDQPYLPLLRMMEFMQSHPRCGILGPKLLNSDGTLQPSVRRFPRAFDPLLFSLGLARQYLARDFDYTKAQHVDQVMGAAFLIRRSMLDAIGMFDERFFIWFEEVDYCKRAKHAGWEVWYTPDASILHHGGESFAQVMTTKKQWMYSKSLLFYFRKQGQWGAYILNLAAVPFRLLFSLIR